MVNEEILGGLKLALSKGESLKQAMMSFYNAGYKKEEIEGAARALQGQQIQPTQATPQQPPQQIQPTQPVQKVPQPKPAETIPRVSDYEQASYSPKVRKGLRGAIKQLEKIDVSLKTKPKVTKQKPVKAISPQKVSDYEKKPKPKGKLITLLLVFFLLFLLGILAAIFFFRQELVEFLNNLF